jgi:hypothetical protein
MLSQHQIMNQDGPNTPLIKVKSDDRIDQEDGNKVNQNTSTRKLRSAKPIGNKEAELSRHL